MKFSLWLERKTRNQKSQEKMPKRKSSQEIAIGGAKARIHDMAGQGDFKKYGRAGSHESKKGTRGEKNRQALRDQY